MAQDVVILKDVLFVTDRSVRSTLLGFDILILSESYSELLSKGLRVDQHAVSL